VYQIYRTVVTIIAIQRCTAQRVLKEKTSKKFQLRIAYIPTKASGYLCDSADVSVWLINRTVLFLVPFLAT
jgi:hypothetical protein